MFQKLTIGVIIALISAIIFLAIFIQRLKSIKRFITDILLANIWFLFCIFSLLQALAYFYLSEEIFRYSYIIILCNAIFIVILVDYISYESINSIRLMCVTGLFTLAVSTSFTPGSFNIALYPNGDWGIFIGGNFRIIASLIFIVMVFIFTYYSSVIYLKAPQNLKRHSALFLLGVLIFGLGSLIVTLLKISQIIPSFHLLIMAIGALIIAFIYVKEPSIAFILPFKVVKLAVIEINKGISLFTHNWGKKEELIEQALFSAMIHSVGQFIEEKLHRGSIREIILDNATLILKKREEYPVLIALITTKSSRSLRKALNCFTTRFIREYSKFFTNPTDISKYERASEIIQDCFFFVPEY